MATLFDVRDEDAVMAGLHQAHAALSRGEIVVVPTDTVYGIGVSPRVPGAIDRVVGAKGRSRDMAPPILVSGADQLASLVTEGAVTDQVQDLVKQFWPGALTIVLPVSPDLGIDFGETPGTIALRAPDQPALLELLRMHGPLAVTSANRHGEPPAASVFHAINTFGDEVAVYLNAGSGSDTDHTPSTIVDATDLAAGGTRLVILREGAVSAEQLIAAGFEVGQ
jgi:tRNA threonylcarbamoyl adenosine modification protein (Sua5/YciO/YrdC/YwlC family)